MFESFINLWSINRLQRFANLHKGETCYIFGGGLSIKWFDIRAFGDHVGIAVNMFPFHKDFSSLNVKYVTITQPWIFTPEVLQPRNDVIRKFNVVSKYYKENIIKKYCETNFFVHPTGFPFMRSDNVECLFRKIPIADGINPNINHTDACSGAFSASLMLAYLLGFSKAYLIGFDAWSLEPAYDGRWIEFGASEPHPILDTQDDFLAILLEKMEIIAVGVDGEANKNMNYIKYEELTKLKASYRENSLLIESKLLSVLSSFPYYRLYDSKRI